MADLNVLVSELVERLTREGLIGMRAAAAIEGAAHASTPTRHHLRGVKTAGGVVRLEAIRCGGKLMTSKAAVLRFLEQQNAAAGTGGTVPPASPSTRARAASKASAELGALLGVAT